MASLGLASPSARALCVTPFDEPPPAADHTDYGGITRVGGTPVNLAYLFILMYNSTNHPKRKNQKPTKKTSGQLDDVWTTEGEF